jgi:hypothetical protein
MAVLESSMAGRAFMAALGERGRLSTAKFDLAVTSLAITRLW